MESPLPETGGSNRQGISVGWYVLGFLGLYIGFVVETGFEFSTLPRFRVLFGLFLGSLFAVPVGLLNTGIQWSLGRMLSSCTRCSPRQAGTLSTIPSGLFLLSVAVSILSRNEASAKFRSHLADPVPQSVKLLEYGSTRGIGMTRSAIRFDVSSNELTQIKRNRGYLPMERADSAFTSNDPKIRSLAIQDLGREIQRWTGLTLDLSQPIHVEISHASRVTETARGNTNQFSLRPDRKEYLIQRLNDSTVLYFLSTD